jgi:hypothetical protein
MWGAKVRAGNLKAKQKSKRFLKRRTSYLTLNI